jgi:tetratricopeptide (TPR) repeat protein
MRIFLSSTYEDMKPYVHAAEEMLGKLSVEVVQFKHWEATGRPSVPECKERVHECDALVVLVGKTYGWIPAPEHGGDGRTSITRFEVRWAREKPMPVLPFFIHEPSSATESSDEAAALLDEFVAELQATLGKPVASFAAFVDDFRLSVVALVRAHVGSALGGPAQVGQRTQGIFSEFFDRAEPRQRLRSALTADRFRGAAVVGRGGLGKSALANWVIDALREEGAIQQVIYLSSVPEKFPYALFESTMAASGSPKIVYEGSWAALNKNPRRLVEVLLDVYRRQRVLLVLDAFEHNLDEDGAMRSPVTAAFFAAFLTEQHASKLLLTTRRFPALPMPLATGLDEIQLERGLPLDAAVSLLSSLLPNGLPTMRARAEAAVRALDGIPFAVERMADLLRKDRLIDVGKAGVHEGTLDAFVELAHSTLSPDARMTLQARAVFDEAVSVDALRYVLAEVLAPAAVDAAVAELGQGHFLFRLGPEGLLGLHEFDKESSYRSLERDQRLDRRQLHARAADWYARSCEDRESWFDWTSYDELRNDIKRFGHLVKAEQAVAAANTFSVSKLEFLNYSGHVEEVRQMFSRLDVGEEPSRALLVKRYAIADARVVVGPFERAIAELKEVIVLAQQLGETSAELSASYELGLAYRYTGQGEEAVRVMQSVRDRLRKHGTEKSLTYCLYGLSLACCYSGRYAEAVRLGQELVRHGRRVGEPYFIGRGKSTLCFAYHLIGKAEQAAACAADSAREFVGTPDEHLVGFIENVRGLSLHALGRGRDAIEAYTRAREAGKRTVQRRVEGLVAANLAWTLYDQSDVDGALLQIADAIRVFKRISPLDARLAHHLREAFEYARDRDTRYEAEALAGFVRDEYTNPDLIQRATVAARILALGAQVSVEARQAAHTLIEETQSRRAAILAELAD